MSKSENYIFEIEETVSYSVVFEKPVSPEVALQLFDEGDCEVLSSLVLSQGNIISMKAQEEGKQTK